MAFGQNGPKMHPDLSWTFSPAVLAGVALLGGVYVRRWRAVRRSPTRGPAEAPVWRLCCLLGSLLLVLRTGHSHRDVTGAKLEMLDRLPIRLLGAVLNDIPREAAYGYYAYYSYYLPGYEAVDESKHGRRTPAPTVV